MIKEFLKFFSRMCRRESPLSRLIQVEWQIDRLREERIRLRRTLNPTLEMTATEKITLGLTPGSPYYSKNIKRARIFRRDELPNALRWLPDMNRMYAEPTHLKWPV